jgi:hypothetical protein
MNVVKVLLLDCVDEEFEGDTLEPSDVSRLRAPVAVESPSIPAAVNCDADAP